VGFLFALGALARYDAWRMRFWHAIIAHKVAICVGATTIGVIAGMFMPDLAICFAVISGVAWYLNDTDDPRNQKRPPDPP
jgi:hypothetical protein